MDFPWRSSIATCLLASPSGGVNRGMRRVHSLCSGTRSSEQKPLRLLSPRKLAKRTDAEATGGGADDAAAEGILGVSGARGVNGACSEESRFSESAAAAAAAAAAVMRGAGGVELFGERAPWRGEREGGRGDAILLGLYNGDLPGDLPSTFCAGGMPSGRKRRIAMITQPKKIMKVTNTASIMLPASTPASSATKDKEKVTNSSMRAFRPWSSKKLLPTSCFECRGPLSSKNSAAPPASSCTSCWSSVLDCSKDGHPSDIEVANATLMGATMLKHSRYRRKHLIRHMLLPGGPL
mmetsp:Transcript_8848/g.16935  ORF Transcript_8848/g.16935 Transcript_8848/m.16935 type:complete len:294 (+) Transcript_8848:472-1353(+)